MDTGNWVALGGVAVAFISNVITVYTTRSNLHHNRQLEERRWQREDVNRFRAERRQAYVRFTGSVIEMITESAPVLPNNFSEIMSDVGLLGGSQVRVALNQVNVAAKAYVEAHLQEYDMSIKEERRRQVTKALRGFDTAARDELGLVTENQEQ